MKILLQRLQKLGFTQEQFRWLVSKGLEKAQTEEIVDYKKVQEDFNKLNKPWKKKLQFCKNWTTQYFEWYRARRPLQKCNDRHDGI